MLLRKVLNSLNEDLINLSKARLFAWSTFVIWQNENKGTVNRAYYAAFHSLRAILILDDFDSKKHSGIIAKFRENYLKTEIFNKEISEYISSLFRVRTASNYDDFFIVSKEDSVSQLEKAEKIVSQIKSYLKTKYWYKLICSRTFLSTLRRTLSKLEMLKQKNF